MAHDDERPPAPKLRRGPGGSFILEDVDQLDEAGEVDEARGEEVPSRRRRSLERAGDAVGGPIRPQPTIYFGRPPGTENRRAGAAALVGAAALLLEAVTPWATRSPDHLDPTHLGWRDANGHLGPGWFAVVLGLAALGLAVAALRGRTDPWLRWADAGVGALTLLLLLVEGTRILQAGRTAEEVSAGDAAVEPGWGLAALLAAAVALGVAAVVHRSQPPAWRQG